MNNIPFEYKIAVLIPCLNEEKSIREVVEDFQESLPSSAIYVYDNNSTDSTAKEAKSAGAFVCSEEMRGKGNVVRRMFADIEADIYVLVDGDSTYDAKIATSMCLLLIEKNADVVLGRRINEETKSFRFGHVAGNYALTKLVQKIFGRGVTDMLTGYRVMSRRFVKTFPSTSTNFEIETELTAHALEQRLVTLEYDCTYRARKEGSVSKLKTYSDGYRILLTIVNLVRNEKPLIFYVVLAFITSLASLSLSIPIFIEYYELHTVSRIPTALFCTGLGIIACILVAVGLILDSIATGRKEIKRFHYLNFESIRSKSIKS